MAKQLSTCPQLFNTVQQFQLHVAHALPSTPQSIPRPLNIHPHHLPLARRPTDPSDMRSATPVYIATSANRYSHCSDISPDASGLVAFGAGRGIALWDSLVRATALVTMMLSLALYPILFGSRTDCHFILLRIPTFISFTPSCPGMRLKLSRFSSFLSQLTRCRRATSPLSRVTQPERSCSGRGLGRMAR